MSTRPPIAKVAWFACTSKSIVIIGAISVRMTAVRVDIALVNICTRLPVPGKACVAYALVAAISVSAFCVDSTVVCAQTAFVHIYRASKELDFTGAVVVLVVMAHNYNFDKRRRHRLRQRKHLHSSFRLEVVCLRGAVRKLQMNLFVPILLF